MGIDLGVADTLPFSAEAQFAGVDLLSLWQAADFERGALDGTLYGGGAVEGQLRQGLNPLGDARGLLALHARDGQINRKIPIMVAIALASDQFNPFLDREQLPYQAIDAVARVKKGKLVFDNVQLHAPTLRMGATGKGGVIEPYALEGVVGLFFFPGLDSLIDRVPILNRVILGRNGNFVGAYFQLTGKWEEPEASLIPIQTIATGPTGFLTEGIPGFVLGGIRRIQSVILPSEGAAPFRRGHGGLMKRRPRQAALARRGRARRARRAAPRRARGADERLLRPAARGARAQPRRGAPHGRPARGRRQRRRHRAQAQGPPAADRPGATARGAAGRARLRGLGGDLPGADAARAARGARARRLREGRRLVARRAAREGCSARLPGRIRRLRQVPGVRTSALVERIRGAEEAAGVLKALRDEVGRVVVGQTGLVDGLLIGLLAGGHVLVEGVPGLAKTTAVRSLAQALGLGFRRIQFTPDLLPGDLIGTQIFLPEQRTFSVRRGPIFAPVILADEINRAPAKVQSALLEAMEERQVTIGDETFVSNT